MFTLSGSFLWLSVLRWRQPEARLLLAMGAVPQLLFFADQLTLFLVARNRREAVLFTAAGAVVGSIWVASSDSSPGRSDAV